LGSPGLKFDGLFTRSDGFEIAERPPPERREVEGRLEALAAHLEVAYRELAESLVVARRDEFQQRLIAQVRELDALYFHPYEGIPPLHGLPRDAVSLDRALEAEHRARLQDLCARCTCTLHMHLLSIGTIRCRAKHGRDGGGPFVRVPFARLRSDGKLKRGSR
jgi:hypothetical protein